MKQIMTIVLAALLLAGCAEKEPSLGDKGIDIIKRYIEEVKKIETEDDFNNFNPTDLEAWFEEMDALLESGDTTLYDQECGKVEPLLNELDSLFEAKYEAFGYYDYTDDDL